MFIATVGELISLEMRYGLYTLAAYAAYCSEIRRQIFKQAVSKEAKVFFEKKFAEEMEPLLKICQKHFQGQESKVQVQCVKNDPPDGKIFFQGVDESSSNLRQPETCALSNFA